MTGDTQSLWGHTAPGLYLLHWHRHIPCQRTATCSSPAGCSVQLLPRSVGIGTHSLGTGPLSVWGQGPASTRLSPRAPAPPDTGVWRSLRDGVPHQDSCSAGNLVTVQLTNYLLIKSEINLHQRCSLFCAASPAAAAAQALQNLRSAGL